MPQHDEILPKSDSDGARPKVKKRLAFGIGSAAVVAALLYAGRGKPRRKRTA